MSIIIQFSKTLNEKNYDTDSIISRSASFNSSTNPHDISVLSLTSSNLTLQGEEILSSFESIKKSKEIEREIIIQTDKDRIYNNSLNESNR
jgi:hypothetical protein